MFVFFKRFKKIECYHDWHYQDQYYEHILTEYVNGGDRIALHRVYKCMKCLETNVEKVNEKYYPLVNSQSRNMKNEHLELLKKKGVKSKEEYLLSNLDN